MEDEGLRSRIKFFVHDLLQFSSDVAGARRRLLHDAAACPTFYLSSVYFSPEEVPALLAVRNADDVALDQALQSVVARKVEEAASRDDGQGVKYEICTSHDLAPVSQEFLGIPKGFQAEVQHKRLYKKFGKEWAKKHRSGAQKPRSEREKERSLWLGDLGEEWRWAQSARIFFVSRVSAPLACWTMTSSCSGFAHSFCYMISHLQKLSQYLRVSGDCVCP